MTKEPVHIFVVEDHLPDYVLIEDYLEDEIKEVRLTRSSTYEETKLLLVANNHFDAILLDLSLPDSASGESLVKEMVNLAGATPVIVLTGYSNKEFGVKTLAMGISDYLFKDDLNGVSLSKSIFYAIERKRIEIKLIESEQKYKTLFDQSPLPMWVVDRIELKFLSVNDAAVRMYGYSREEFLQMGVKDLWVNKEEPEIQDLITRKRDNHFTLRIKHKNKQGQVMILDVQSNPILFDNVEARVSLINNVTAQVEAEEALLYSEQRFKALVQDGSDLVMVFDCRGNLTYVSPSSTVVTGIAAEKLLLNNFFYLIHPEDVDMIKDHIRMLETEKRIQIPSYRIKSSGNGWRWVETIITNLSHDPAVRGIVANSRDITEAILQKKKLQESLQRYDIVAKATSDTITDYDIVNNVMHYNEGLENMFGYCLNVVDRTVQWWNDKIHPEDKERVKQKVAEMYKQKASHLKIEYRFRCADGSYKYILDRSYMVRDEDGKPARMIGSMQDITDLNNHIQAIETHNERLKEIAWTQSHVVRAPLARIMGLIDLLQHYREKEDIELLIKNISTSAQELDGIIRKITIKTEEVTEKGI